MPSSENVFVFSDRCCRYNRLLLSATFFCCLHPVLGPVLLLVPMVAKQCHLLPLHGRQLSHHSGQRLPWLAWLWFHYATQVLAPGPSWPDHTLHTMTLLKLSIILLFPVVKSYTRLQLFSCQPHQQQRQDQFILLLCRGGMISCLSSGVSASPRGTNHGPPHTHFC